jgi:hypothetical protein
LRWRASRHESARKNVRMDFRIWGSVEQSGPGRYVAIACAVREDSTEPANTRAITQGFSTRLNAEEGLREIVNGLRDLIVSLGARVTAVETDRPT